MRRIAQLFLLLIGLLGCREEDSPVVSGKVVDGGLFLGRYIVERREQQPKAWTLTQEQLRQVSLWLHEHRSGWRLLVVSPPPPAFSIVLKHANGTHTQVDLFSANENWQRAIIVSASDPSNTGIQYLSTQELNALRQLVKEGP